MSLIYHGGSELIEECVHELACAGGGVTNDVNDCAPVGLPLSRGSEFMRDS